MIIIPIQFLIAARFPFLLDIKSHVQYHTLNFTVWEIFFFRKTVNVVQTETHIFGAVVGQ